LCTRFGIDRSIRVKHGALIDAQLLAQVYVELTGGRQIGLSLSTATLAGEAVSESAEGRVIAGIRPPRPHAASDAELERHAAFMREIADPLWNRFEGARLTENRGSA
jgi:DNA polymerase-3 subunit epsilon